MNALDREFASCVRGDHPQYLRHPATGLFVRDRGDVGVIEQQNLWAPLRQFTYSPDTRLLDLGGHIGTSIWYFFKHKIAGRIVSVEADPGNAEVRRANWHADPRVHLIDAAVISDPEKQSVNLHLGKTYTSCHSLEFFRGRQSVAVPTIQFAAVLDIAKPDVIKCDIEGSEFLLDWEELPPTVTEICMELHQFRPDWLEKGRTLDDFFLSSGFRHMKAPKHQPLFHKCQIAIWSRR